MADVSFGMAPSSVTPAEKARNAGGRVLQAMQTPGKGGAIAAAMGVSDSAVSRLKNEHLEPVLQLLYHLGFKVVPEDFKCVDPETFAFLTRKHAQILARAPELIWESSDA